jgi:tetratricopeptide (TPR) repeat protein
MTVRASGHAWSLAFGLVVVCLLSAPPRARADEHGDARAHYDRATAAYALGHFADAAAEFEQAFTLKPDPAILYNAAQATRLAGRRERALELYRSYLRVYGRRAEHAPDVEWHIAELEKQMAADAHDGGAEPPSAAPAAPPPAPPPAVGAAPATTLTERATPDASARPVYRRWWFWAGAGAVVLGAVVAGIALSRRSPDCGAGVDSCVNTGL